MTSPRFPNERNYKREYEIYHAKPKQRKRRSQRNASRAKLKKLGYNVVGKDVNHINHNTADQRLENLNIQSPSVNRSNNQKK